MHVYSLSAIVDHGPAPQLSGGFAGRFVAIRKVTFVWGALLKRFDIQRSGFYPNFQLNHCSDLFLRLP
jgi:hypothetical protein